MLVQLVKHNQLQPLSHSIDVISGAGLGQSVLSTPSMPKQSRINQNDNKNMQTVPNKESLMASRADPTDSEPNQDLIGIGIQPADPTEYKPAAAVITYSNDTDNAEALYDDDTIP